ncbi:MAG: flotillin-like protein FloA [Planctomycetota bacterium]|jgi:uncharacterized protein YqfA (UPF0365 family)
MHHILAAPHLAEIDYKVVLLVLLLLVVFVLLLIFLKFFKLWIQAFMAGARISMWELVGMWLRKVNATTIVRSKIAMVQAGLPIETKDLEAHYLAGGNVPSVIRSFIAADRARIELAFPTACAIDLAGRDVLDAIHTSVNPKVIDCPDPRKDKTYVAAVAKDGIQVLARARVTVRTNLKQLVGGATEDTIVARVGEGIVSTIGSAESHKDVLENPDSISKTVLAKSLDSGTAFSILSIDIADVDIGENIGARLQTDQAEADKRVAQAKAEERRALAVAREQEMQAAVVENRAKVVLAEAEIPRAFAESLRSGNIGVMDYYNLRNIQADTEMRRSLGGAGEEKGREK